LLNGLAAPVAVQRPTRRVGGRLILHSFAGQRLDRLRIRSAEARRRNAPYAISADIQRVKALALFSRRPYQRNAPTGGEAGADLRTAEPEPV